jgi:DNA-directed RNA polymerase specialized sigma24 family protein
MTGEQLLFTFFQMLHDSEEQLSPSKIIIYLIFQERYWYFAEKIKQWFGVTNDIATDDILGEVALGILKINEEKANELAPIEIPDKNEILRYFRTSPEKLEKKINYLSKQISNQITNNKDVIRYLTVIVKNKSMDYLKKNHFTKTVSIDDIPNFEDSVAYNVTNIDNDAEDFVKWVKKNNYLNPSEYLIFNYLLKELDLIEETYFRNLYNSREKTKKRYEIRQELRKQEAEKMGLSYGNFRVKISRIRENLQKLYNQYQQNIKY